MTQLLDILAELEQAARELGAPRRADDLQALAALALSLQPTRRHSNASSAKV